MKTEDTTSYFYNWQSPQFYRCYYRRFVIVAIFLTLIAIGAVGFATYKFNALYLQEEARQYVSTSEGELILLAPHFQTEPLQKNTGDK